MYMGYNHSAEVRKWMIKMEIASGPNLMVKVRHGLNYMTN